MFDVAACGSRGIYVLLVIVTVADIFRIETDQTRLSWSLSDGSPSDSDADLTHPDGRLAVSPLHRARKNIKIWRSGLSGETGNNPGVEIGPRLYEETSYNLLLRSTHEGQVELRHRDPSILQGLDFSTDGILHGMINFKSQIGRSRFSVYAGGKPEYDFEIEVFPSKLDYFSDYNVLLADTEDILTGLVLEYLRSTYQIGFATDSQSSSRLEWILLLRHVVNDLERALRYIEQHPHHGLTREYVSTRVEKVRRPDARLLKMIAQGKGHGPKLKTASGLVLNSRLPERRNQITWDTPEHRWLASQLTRVRRSLAEIHSAERKRPTHDRLRKLRIIEEITDLENRIAVLQRLGPIAQANGFAPAGFSSLTLQSRPGYREAYRSCLILLQAIRVDGGPVGLCVKDTDRLYEYWCYLALVRLIARITGESLPARELFSIERNGLRVRLKPGTTQTVEFSHADRTLELTYNPRHKDKAFALRQKPDVVLTFRDPQLPTMRLVFDAKYGINPDKSYAKQFGSPGPPQDAIDVLHRYRDAILEETGLQGSRWETFKRAVVEGVALFPYADVKDQFRTSDFWLSLEKSGIGAIPFLPQETRYLEEWLRTLLPRLGWPTTERTIPSFSLQQLRAWQQAEKEPVLIGVLPQNANDYLEWIKTKRCHYTPFISSQRRQLLAGWVAMYSPKSVRTPEAVTHLAAVENIEIKERRQIDTPWLPQRDSDEMQVVYQLSEVRELERPIENRGSPVLGKRFLNDQWTSRLGLMKATQLVELFLETSFEWRLYEQLRIAGAEFTLKPGPARLQDENDPRGRTWFVSKQLRVQYRGAAGFLLRRNGMRDDFCNDVGGVVDRFLSLK